MLTVYQKQTGKKKKRTIHQTDLCQLWKRLRQNRLSQLTLNQIKAKEAQGNFSLNRRGCPAQVCLNG